MAIIAATMSAHTAIDPQNTIATRTGIRVHSHGRLKFRPLRRFRAAALKPYTLSLSRSMLRLIPSAAAQQTRAGGDADYLLLAAREPLVRSMRTDPIPNIDLALHEVDRAVLHRYRNGKASVYMLPLLWILKFVVSKGWMGRISVE